MPYHLSRHLRLGLLLVHIGAASAQSPWLGPYGDGSCGSGFVPTWHTAGEMPTIGNAQFRLVSENLVGGNPGLLLLSGARTSLPVLGLTLLVGPAPLLAVGCKASGTGSVGTGIVNQPLAIPGNVALAGGTLFVQGFFLNISVMPSSLVHTHGLGVTIAQSVAVERAVIQDRLKYKAHFTGATQAQADTLGAAIWTVNQVPGFTYATTQQFTCGGESHWMVIVLHAQTGMEFCLIPGGSFRMGDINGTNPNSSELPVHWMRIKPFLLARTEVPQSVWQPVMGSNPSTFPGPTLPVDNVSWIDAQAFCGRTGLQLPSEAEWEYACRAGVENCYHFGVNYVAPGPANLGLYAWYSGNSGWCTHPVGGKLPNAFGLFDMNGNVCEWCEDWWPNTSDYKCAPTDGRAWLGGSSDRVTRGGSWTHSLGSCRSSYRFMRYPSYHYGYMGVRPSSPLR